MDGADGGRTVGQDAGRQEPVASAAFGWKTLAICVLVAVVLSVTATLLLGGAFGPSGGGRRASGTWSAAGGCCQPGGAR